MVRGMVGEIGRGGRGSTVMSIFSAAEKASSKFLRWLLCWRVLYCNKSGRYRSIKAQLPLPLKNLGIQCKSIGPATINLETKIG